MNKKMLLAACAAATMMTLNCHASAPATDPFCVLNSTQATKPYTARSALPDKMNNWRYATRPITDYAAAFTTEYYQTEYTTEQLKKHPKPLADAWMQNNGSACSLEQTSAIILGVLSKILKECPKISEDITTCLGDMVTNRDTLDASAQDKAKVFKRVNDAFKKIEGALKKISDNETKAGAALLILAKICPTADGTGFEAPLGANWGNKGGTDGDKLTDNGSELKERMKRLNAIVKTATVAGTFGNLVYYKAEGPDGNKEANKGITKLMEKDDLIQTLGLTAAGDETAWD